MKRLSDEMEGVKLVYGCTPSVFYSLRVVGLVKERVLCKKKIASAKKDL
jgi:hypothetical protein